MVFFKKGICFCSYCKLPTGVKFSDLKPLDLTKKEDLALANEVINNINKLGLND